MQIIKEESKFQPVTIILENQEELDTFITAINIGCGDWFEDGGSSFVPKHRIKELLDQKVPSKFWDKLQDFLKLQ